eukprot:TRINITY_DN8702_c0_g1_i9.p1 TRINITY_DN8702_c0_g1~~TRINITY_DN8702_c0_g1_i9.p1  ORF type:complete len:169 (+),score=29.14 TRINITY_DN8702_c0_g1_i9:423-929(+)
MTKLCMQDKRFNMQLLHQTFSFFQLWPINVYAGFYPNKNVYAGEASYMLLLEILPKNRTEQVSNPKLQTTLKTSQTIGKPSVAAARNCKHRRENRGGGGAVKRQQRLHAAAHLNRSPEEARRRRKKRDSFGRRWRSGFGLRGELCGCISERRGAEEGSGAGYSGHGHG